MIRLLACSLLLALVVPLSAQDQQQASTADHKMLIEALHKAAALEQRLDGAGLEIEASVSGGSAPIRMATLSDEALQNDITAFREKYAAEASSSRQTFQKLLSDLALTPEQNLPDELPVTIQLKSNESLVQAGEKLIQGAYGSWVLVVDKERQTYTVSKQRRLNGFDQLADYRARMERTFRFRAFSDAASDQPYDIEIVKKPVFRIRQQNDQRFPADKALSRGTVPSENATYQNLQLAPIVRPPDYLVDVEFNTATGLMQETGVYLNGVPRRKTFSIGAVQVEQPGREDAEPIWFPEYLLEVRYQAGTPHSCVAKRIGSVRLLPDSRFDAAVPAPAGTTIVVKPARGESETITPAQDVDDALWYALQNMTATE